MIPVVPIGGRVLIEPLGPPTETESGLLLVSDPVPETMGRVLSVGEAERPEVKPGDVVLFSWQAGQEVLIDGERVLLVHQDDILAILEERIEPPYVSDDVVTAQGET